MESVLFLNFHFPLIANSLPVKGPSARIERDDVTTVGRDGIREHGVCSIFPHIANYLPLLDARVEWGDVTTMGREV